MATFYTNISAKAYADALSVGLFGAAASQNVENAAAVAMGIPPSQLASTIPTNLQIWNAGIALAQSPLFAAQYGSPTSTVVDAAFFTNLNTALTGSNYLMASELAAFQAVASTYGLNKAQAATYFVAVVLSTDPSSLGLSTVANPGNPGGLSDYQTYLNQFNAATNRAIVSGNFANQSATAANLNYPVVGPTTNAGYVGAVNSEIGVNNLTSTVVVAEGQIAVAAAANNPALINGQTPPTTTYDLTVNVDTYVATAPNSTFNGQIVAANAAGSTFQAFDTLTGFGTGNVLNITATGTAGGAVTAPSAAVSGIQTVNVRNVYNDAQTLTVDASTMKGALTVNSNLSTQVVTVTNLADGAAGGVIGNGTLANADSNFGYVTAATKGIINVSGATAGNIVLTGGGLTSATINSTGVANTIGTLTLTAAGTTKAVTINATTGLTTGAITAGAATSYVITGAGAVNISAATLSNTVTSVDASGNSGGLTVALGNNVTQTVKGSSANDVITTGALVLTTGSIDAGGGTADVLDIGTNVGNLATTALAAKYTNFEVLRVNGTLSMANAPSGITAVQLSGNTNTITNLTAAQAASVQARADLGATTLTLADATGASDVLNIAFGTGSKATAATNAGVLTVTGFETLNLSTNAGPDATAGANRTTTITGAIVDSSLTSVNLQGTAFTFTDASSTNAVTWDATALIGDGSATPVGLTLTSGAGMAQGSIVKGSAVKDAFTISAAVGSTFIGGAGNDTFTTTSTILTPSGAATDVTLDGGLGTADQIILTGASTLTDTSFARTTGMEALQLAGGGVVNSVTGLAGSATAAYATGITVTDTAAQTGANAYTWSSGLYNPNVTLTHETTYAGALLGGNQSITTGNGADTITLTASSWTGGTTGAIAINTGAGVDTITLTTSTLAETATVQAATITAGTGADIVTVTHGIQADATGGFLNSIKFTYAVGDSTTTAYDQVTGFLVGTAAKISDVLDFAAVGVNAYAATAAAGYSAAQLTVAVSAAGAVTFAGTSAAGLTIAQQISAVQSVVNVTQGDTAYWINGGNTYVFNNNTSGDSVVELVGQAGTTSVTTVVGVGAGEIILV